MSNRGQSNATFNGVTLIKLSEKIAQRVLLHAPNIHSGGGLQLLKSLLMACPTSFAWAQLDIRIQGQVFLPQSTTIDWVKKTVWSRLYAEWQIYRRCTPKDTVLCFHGLPPLFRPRGRVVVFVQNRLLFETSSLQGYSPLTRLRLTVERFWTRAMSINCDRYIVQTNSMASVVTHCLGGHISISIMPFVGVDDYTAFDVRALSSKKYDFVYVASGDAHKNHGNLLLAWCLLAEAGFKPSLVLTVAPRSYPTLANKIMKIREKYGVNILNLGWVPRSDIPALYHASSALIFPSTMESFGLPLIEASQLGLPVLGPELDYVRDIIEPVETFDPSSPVSIARAVRRFLKNPEPTNQINSPNEFLEGVLR